MTTRMTVLRPSNLTTVDSRWFCSWHSDELEQEIHIVDAPSKNAAFWRLLKRGIPFAEQISRSYAGPFSANVQRRLLDADHLIETIRTIDERESVDFVRLKALLATHGISFWLEPATNILA